MGVKSCRGGLGSPRVPVPSRGVTGARSPSPLSTMEGTRSQVQACEPSVSCESNRVACGTARSGRGPSRSPVLPAPPVSHLAVPPQPHHRLIGRGEVGGVERHGAVHGAVVGDTAQARAEKPCQVGRTLLGDKRTPPVPPLPGTSARRSRSCRCTRVGNRAVAAPGARTPRSPSCSAERCRGGTCIPASRSSSAGGPAAGTGGRAGNPPDRNPARDACPGPLSTPSLGPGPSLAPWDHPSPVYCWARAGTHHMDNVEGEDLDAAHDGGERADDGGEDGQAADAEEQVLGRSGVSRGHRGARRGPPRPPGPPP